MITMKNIHRLRWVLSQILPIENFQWAEFASHFNAYFIQN